MSLFPHLGRDPLLARTIVKSRKASDVSPKALKKNCFHHLRNTYFGNEGAVRALQEFSLSTLKIKKQREGENKSSNLFFFLVNIHSRVA